MNAGVQKVVLGQQQHRESDESCVSNSADDLSERSSRCGVPVSPRGDASIRRASFDNSEDEWPRHCDVARPHHWESDMLSVLAAACSTADRRAAPRKKRPRLAPFPNKLQDIVLNNSDVVTWDNRSRALVVLDPKRLTSEVMPRYFNTNGGDGLLKSFTRQLNYYGFHRIASQNAKTADLSSSMSPVRLLHLRASELPSPVRDDVLLAFYRQFLGDDAIVFINKDDNVRTLEDFGHLVRFEKAAERPLARSPRFDSPPRAFEQQHPFARDDPRRQQLPVSVRAHDYM